MPRDMIDRTIIFMAQFFPEQRAQAVKKDRKSHFACVSPNKIQPTVIWKPRQASLLTHKYPTTINWREPKSWIKTVRLIDKWWFIQSCWIYWHKYWFLINQSSPSSFSWRQDWSGAAEEVANTYWSPETFPRDVNGGLKVGIFLHLSYLSISWEYLSEKS